jgi:hypothetical protein
MNTRGLEHPTITIDQLEPHLQMAWKCQRSLFIIGDFGVGKTTVVSDFAKGQGADFHTMVASMMDRLDLGGLPYGDPGSDTTRMRPSAVIAGLSKERNPDGAPAVLYLNEFNAAPDSVQPVFLRLIGERKIGDLSIRDNVLVVADGNPSSASRLSRDLPEPTRRRFNWLMVRSSAATWCDYAARRGLNPLVGAFVSQQARFFYTFDPSKKHHLCYACGASWDRVASDLAHATDIFGGDGEGLTTWVCGLVGVEAGQQFAAFLRHRNSIPDVFKFLAKPKTGELPSGADAFWVFLASVAQVTSENPSKFLDPTSILAGRLFRENMVEGGAYLVRYLVRNPGIGRDLWDAKGGGELMDEIMKHPELVQALLKQAAGQ